jgi:hypothetical protein
MGGEQRAEALLGGRDGRRRVRIATDARQDQLHSSSKLSNKAIE